ncbi:DMT family transporter [Paenibacillus radicis (ex Xue et al. 2023)]|uniref:DMT family transporter n=1 Tax=Paenibacillus radicis (ex Xue et al. 2023) TaxID=2972489 RepID=A0ABT1YM96_9BACL|nr:DMT family transporter [Paenibacillus radicis (ex Xue et al. 2023)]MCR8634294.1 DMT family transporter [Paenibacillus radicis (ex Xue et al. 2023)]
MVRSYILLLFCVCCWGSNFVFGSILVNEFPPILLSAIRLSATSLFLIGYGWSFKKLGHLTRRDFLLLIPLGFVGTLINQAAFFTGLETIDATTASLILSLAPITVAVLAAVFLKETITRKMVIGSVIAMVGIFFVVGKSGGIKPSIGMLYIVLAMISFAISIIIMRKLTERIDPLTATVYSTLIGSGMVIPVALIKEPITHVSSHPWAWVLLFVTAILMQGLCGLIWNVQLKRIGAGKASVFLNLQPFVAMVVGFLLMGTPVTIVQIVGSMLIVGGVVLATGLKKGKPEESGKPVTATGILQKVPKVNG